MAERNLAQQLTDVDTAIEKVLKALSLGIAGRTFTRERLSELRKERNDILKHIAHETGNGRRLAEF